MMKNRLSRMQFLRGDFRGKHTPLRPPWAVSEALFTEICTACGECIRQCPQGILKAGRSAYPIIDFHVGECLFCEACVEACRPRALLSGARGSTPHDKVWDLVACIASDSCLAHHGVECRSCVDPCERRAITMPPRCGGHPLPQIDSASCNGCGACVSVCPVTAISMVHAGNDGTDNDEVQDAYQWCTG